MNNEAETKELLQAPRRLGSEWESWEGNLEENNGDLDTSPWYFIGFASIGLSMVNIAGLFILYMMKPRLALIHPDVDLAVSLIVYTALLLTDITLLLVVLTVLTQKPFAFFLKKKELANLPIIPLTIRIGKMFGLSRDRMTNSVMRAGNILTKAIYDKVHPDDLLIVVPRCLSMFTRKELTALTEKYGVTFHTAGGGNAARELLVKEKPKAIIAVACERDLFSGLQDVGGNIPVMAITNKRPEGPCRNTFINFEEMEEAIQHFLGTPAVETNSLVEA
ncbi:DUF116 domain-containing protein [Aneurinibacillus terranovensis]|uniref:DUF116 domain-containing protein n=1 Tax=Aneurinibacillus terranovensis TaxID=278991 RepID=UPI0004119133|nr:DUF116 domain-containing protein [Aneurinibacillus terranovensis]